MGGIARQASAQLLPTLNALAGAFLETFTEGGRLQGGIEVLSARLLELELEGLVASLPGGRYQRVS